jgi:hypothetical protein
LRLEEHLLYLLVAHEHRVAPRALAEVEVALVDEQAHRLGEGAVAVGQQGSRSPPSWSLPHSSITNGSLTATQTIESMPAFMNAGASSL